MKKTILLLFAALFVLGSAVVGFSAAQQETAEEKVFVIARSTDAKTLDAGFGYAEGEMDPIFHIYDGLVHYKNNKLEVEPALATSWDVSENGTLWTFNLRKGVKFHDGTDFNADAVVFSYTRLIDENHPYYGLGSWSYFDYLLGEVIEDVRAKDEYTVEIKLKNKFAPFLTYMGYYSEYIVSPTAVKKYGEEFFKHPVGTGPFVFEEWKKDEYIVLSKNEDYWGEKPGIDKLIWKVIPDNTTRLMELETGQVHAIKSISPDQLEKVKNNPDVELKQIAGANSFFATLNTTKEPFDDVRVRQAVQYAVDMDKLVEGVYEGIGVRAVSVLPPTVFAFDESLDPYPYDPQKAKALLREAGYPNGFDMEIHTFVEARPYIARPVDAAEIIKSDLEKVGINATVQANEWGTHKSIYNNLEHQMGFAGWFDIPHPSNFLNTLLIKGLKGGWQPEEAVELAQKALSTYDRDEQEKYWKQVQHLAYEQCPVLPIAHNAYTAAIRKNVKGFELDVLGIARMHTADID
jgi:peptide/nickel transport system substrate-binding protein